MTTTPPIVPGNSVNKKVTSIPLADANGNCVTYLDNAGNIQDHYTYDAFGGTVSSAGDMDDDFHFRFSSKYLDDETGLYYYGFRYDSPALGRWMSWDPIEEEGGFLLYGFIANDGINSWDLLGQSKQSSIKEEEPKGKDSKGSNEFLQNVVLDCMTFYSVNLDGKTLIHIWDCFKDQKDPKSCVLDYVKPNAFHMFCCIGKAYEKAMRPKNFSELDKCHLNLCACNKKPTATKACHEEFDCCVSKLGLTPDPFAHWY